MFTVTERAYGKINLALNITGCANGLHLLDGVTIPIGIHDVVRMKRREDGAVHLRYTGGYAAEFPIDNAKICAERLVAYYRLSGVDIEIEKNIPIGAGLGGSSADAAGTARGMRRLFGLPQLDSSLLLSMGSDVPAQYAGGSLRVSGKGEKIFPVDLPTLYAVLLLPSRGVDTKTAFALYDSVGGESGSVDGLLAELQKKGRVTFFNALRRAAQQLVPEIADALQRLTECGFMAGMSGSGSAAFGVLYDKAEYQGALEKLKRNCGTFRMIEG